MLCTYSPTCAYMHHIQPTCVLTHKHPMCACAHAHPHVRVHIVNKAEIDVFLKLSCSFDDPTDVGNLISGSSTFSKSSLNIWKFTVHILLKSGLKNCPQFVEIHTVKGFGTVNKEEVDVFLELPCFVNDPMDVGNLISGSSAFSKTSLNVLKFTVHVLLKPGLENSEHYVASM